MFNLRIPVFDILEGETRMEVSVLPEDLDLEFVDVEFKERILIIILLSRFGRMISGNAEIETSVELICARCLKKFRYKVESKFELQMKVERGASRFANFLDEDFAFLDETNGLIDLRERIREEIVFDIPRIPICDENCVGIEFNEEKNNIIDPRWEKLNKVKNNN
ncbi:DUF177 domain-containing protein [bacterium]|nr:DUF177 domain-containing protein [bacterium]